MHPVFLPGYACPSFDISNAASLSPQMSVATAIIYRPKRSTSVTTPRTNTSNLFIESGPLRSLWHDMDKYIHVVLAQIRSGRSYNVIDPHIDAVTNVSFSLLLTVSYSVAKDPRKEVEKNCTTVLAVQKGQMKVLCLVIVNVNVTKYTMYAAEMSNMTVAIRCVFSSSKYPKTRFRPGPR